MYCFIFKETAYMMRDNQYPYLWRRGSLSGAENNFAIDCKTWLAFSALDFSALIKPTKSLYSASVSFSLTCRVFGILGSVGHSLIQKRGYLPWLSKFIYRNKTKFLRNCKLSMGKKKKVYPERSASVHSVTTNITP